MRRLWVAATLAVSVLSACSSGDKPEVPDVTIPVETTVATTAPPVTTEAPTTVAESTTTVVTASPEDELRAATQAYWAEFRRTLLNLQTDDLSTLSSFYQDAKYAVDALSNLKSIKDGGSTFVDGEPPVYRVRVDDVAVEGNAWVVRACVADNLVELSNSATGQSVVDDSAMSTIFTFRWVESDGVWKISAISDLIPVEDGSMCE